jgi:hypothetical protein
MFGNNIDIQFHLKPYLNSHCPIYHYRRILPSPLTSELPSFCVIQKTIHCIVFYSKLIREFEENNRRSLNRRLARDKMQVLKQAALLVPEN